jgi:tRNA G37 N-methylase TrmD
MGTNFVSLREKHRLRVFENRVLRRIFAGNCITDNGELSNLYFLQSVIRMIKSKGIR